MTLTTKDKSKLKKWGVYATLFLLSGLLMAMGLNQLIEQLNFSSFQTILLGLVVLLFTMFIGGKK